MSGIERPLAEVPEALLAAGRHMNGSRNGGGPRPASNGSAPTADLGPIPPGAQRAWMLAQLGAMIDRGMSREAANAALVAELHAGRFPSDPDRSIWTEDDIAGLKAGSAKGGDWVPTRAPKVDGDGVWLPAGALAYMPTPEPPAPVSPFVDLAAILSGTTEPEVPSLMRRTDGSGLLYPGKQHAFIGEPESGKTWVALAACAEAIREDRDAVLIDFEDSPATAVARMLALGTTPEQILSRLRYVDPTRLGWEHAELVAALRDRPPAVIVIDSVAEAMAAGQYDENSNADAVRFNQQFVDPLASPTTAIVMLDHIRKDDGGRYARGASAKLANIDGAVYRLNVRQAFSRTMVGTVSLILTKDRPGGVEWARGQNNSRKAGDVTFTPGEDGKLSISISAPSEVKYLTVIMQRVTEAIAGAGPGPISQTALRSLVQGKAEHISKAIADLVSAGYVSQQTGARGGGWSYVLVKPFVSGKSDPQEASSGPKAAAPALATTTPSRPLF